MPQTVEIESKPLVPGKRVCIGIYGISGSGKTRLIGSAPNTLIIRPPTDHTDSISKPPPGLEEVVVSNYNELFAVHRALQQGDWEKEWVWLDTITLFQEFGLDDKFAAAVARKPERDEFGPDKGEYGLSYHDLSKWTRDMVGLSKAGKFNFGWTAHVMDWTDPTKDEDLWAPFIQGKNMSPKFCGYMNIIAYLRATEKDGERQEELLVDPAGFVGKDQYHCFPTLKSGRHGILNPTMADIEAAIDSRRRTGGKRRRSRASAASKRTAGPRKRPVRRKK